LPADDRVDAGFGHRCYGVLVTPTLRNRLGNGQSGLRLLFVANGADLGDQLAASRGDNDRVTDAPCAITEKQRLAGMYPPYVDRVPRLITADNDGAGHERLAVDEKQWPTHEATVMDRCSLESVAQT
jgi:hypothetical protein